MLATMWSCWLARLCTSVYKQCRTVFVSGSGWSPTRFICDRQECETASVLPNVHANLPTSQRNCPISSWRRLCEQVFVLSQELRQRLRWLAGEVLERVADVIESLIFGRASAQVAP